MNLLRHLVIFFGLVITLQKVEARSFAKKFEGSFKEWEKHKIELLSFFLPKDPIIFVAGGLHENETLNFKNHWKNSNIIVFEPNPDAFEILSSKVRHFSNIKAYPFALSNISTVAPLYIYFSEEKNKDLKYCSLLPHNPNIKNPYQEYTITVHAVNLDDWCEQNKVDHIDFMRLDLQGVEYQSLKNSPQILKTVKVIHINTFMFPFRKDMTEYVKLKSFLEENGFLLLSHWYEEGKEGNAIFIKKEFYYNFATDDFLKKNFIASPKYRKYYEKFFKSYYYLDNDKEDSIKNTIKKGSPYEGNIGIIINQLTKKGSVAIDVGAHIGIHTITMSRKTGPHGSVIAFEPNKKLYMELLSTIKINNCNNVIPIAKGLGEIKKNAILNGIEIEQEDILDAKGDYIDIIPLDSINIDNLSLIKIDVENYEYFVLKGAKNTILKNKPIIIFECWIGADYNTSPPAIKENFDRVISLIESYGYEIYVIYCNDFIAFPIGKDKEFKRYKNKFKKLNLDAFDLGL